MIDKMVKTRKEHRCAYCHRIIPAGSYAGYMEFRAPLYENGNQVGIRYYHDYFCIEPSTEESGSENWNFSCE